MCKNSITIEEAIHFKVLDPETGEVNPDATGMNSGGQRGNNIKKN